MPKKQKEETSIKYVTGVINQTIADLKKGEHTQIPEYYKTLKEIQLALGEQKNGGYNQILAMLYAVKTGDYSQATAAADLLAKTKPNILQKVRSATGMDKSLAGRTDPSSIKREVFTRLGKQSTQGQYGSDPYK